MFQQSVRLLSREKSASVRERFIQTFIDTSSANFLERIAATRSFWDGEKQTGYLWECFRRCNRISYEQFIAGVMRHDPVLVMADDLSRVEVVGAPLWAYPPGSVISLSPDTLIPLLPALPEDLYVFDESVSWTLALTHEHEGQDRICVEITN